MRITHRIYCLLTQSLHRSHSFMKICPYLRLRFMLDARLCAHYKFFSYYYYHNPLSTTFLFLSEGQQPLFPSCITLPLESASQGTSPAYRSRRLITLIWSHTCQFVISCIITVTIHYSFSLPLQTQNSSFPQIYFKCTLNHCTSSSSSSSSSLYGSHADKPVNKHMRKRDLLDRGNITTTTNRPTTTWLVVWRSG